MKRERKRIRHDYSKVEAEENKQIRSKEYYGIFVRNGRVHIDTKRFRKTLKRMGAEEFWRDDMAANRNTPYLIPKKISQDDYGVNIAKSIIRKLRDDWAEEFLPAIQSIKTPKEVEEAARLGAIATRSAEDAYEESQAIGFYAALERGPKYYDVIRSLYCSYVQRIASECDRAMALMFRKRGNVGDAFTFDELIGHINELAGGDKKKKLERVKNYKAFETVRKLDNFLKHHTVKSYNAAKKFCPTLIAKGDMAFQNGMYAPEWIAFPENFIEDSLNSLETFFIDFCLMFFGETAEEAEWNNDEYFLKAYSEICDPEVYYGIYDKWGNCLIG